MADPTLKIIITAEAKQATDVINAIASQISDLAKTATSQVKMAIPKITVPEGVTQKLETKGVLDFTNEASKMEKAYIASLLKMATSTEDFNALIKEIAFTKGEPYKFLTLGMADLYKTKLDLIEKTKKASEQTTEEEIKLKEWAVNTFETLQQRETAVILNQKLKEAKTIKDVEAMKIKAIELSGNEHLKFQNNISNKVIKIQEKEAKEQAKLREESIKHWKGNILGGVNVAMRSITGIFAGLGMASTALATRAGSDWVRSYIPIANIQARFRAIGRIFEGLFKSLTQVVFGFYRFLWNITTSVLSSIANVFKRTFQVASIAITAFFTKAIYDLANFEHAIQAVMTLIPQATEGTFERAFEGVSEIVRKFPVDFLDTAKGLLEVVSTGFEDLNDALIVTEEGAVGATAGLTQTSTAISGLLTVLSAYDLEASESSRINDLMFRTVDKSRASYGQLAQEMGFFVGIARNANLALEETFATFSLLTRVVRPEQAGILTARLIEAITVPAKEAENMMRAFDILPFRFDELGNRIFMGMERFFVRLAEMNLPTQVLRAMFPDERQFRAITSIISQGVDNIRQMFASYTDTIGASREAMEKMMNTLPNIFKRIWENLKGAGVQLVKPFLEGFRTIAKKARDFVVEFNKTISYITKAGGFDRIKNSFQEIADSLNITFSRETFVAMFEAVEPIILRILDYVKQIPDYFKSFVSDIKVASDNLITNYLPKIADIFFTVANTFLKITELAIRALAPALKILNRFINRLEARSEPIKEYREALTQEATLQKQLSEILNEQRIREGIGTREELGGAKRKGGQGKGLFDLFWSRTGIDSFSNENLKQIETETRKALDIIQETITKYELKPSLLEPFDIAPEIDKTFDLVKEGSAFVQEGLTNLSKTIQDWTTSQKEANKELGTTNNSFIRLRENIEKMLTPLESYKGLLGRLPKFKPQFEFEKAQVERQKTLDEFKNRLLLPKSPFGLLTIRKRSPLEEQQNRIALGLERFKNIKPLEGVIEDFGFATDQIKEFTKQAQEGKYSVEQIRQSSFDLRQQLVDTFGASSIQVQRFEQDMRNLNLINKDFGTTLRDVFATEAFEEQAGFYKNIAQNIVGAIRSITDELKNTLSNFFQTGKFRFREFGQFIRKLWFDLIAQMITEWLKLQIITGLGKILPAAIPTPTPTGAGGGGGGGNFLGEGGFGKIPLRHQGGIITEDMPRFHSGGLGLFNQDERVAVLQTGEGVLSREGIKNLGMLNNGKAPQEEKQPVNFNFRFDINAIDPVTGERAVQALMARQKPLLYSLMAELSQNQWGGR